MPRAAAFLAIICTIAAAGVVVLAHHQASDQRGAPDPGVAIIVSDAIDGKIDGKWSCPSMRFVADRVPALVYSKSLSALRDATGRTCLSALGQLQRGASPSRVVSLLGRPDKAPRCWLYRWPLVAGASGDGARICFAGQRVDLIQTTQHL